MDLRSSSDIDDDLEHAAQETRRSEVRESDARSNFKKAMQRALELTERRALDARAPLYNGTGNSCTLPYAAFHVLYDPTVANAGAKCRVIDSVECELASGTGLGGDERIARLEEEVKRLQKLASQSAAQLQRFEARVYTVDQEAESLKNALNNAELERRAEARYDSLLAEFEFIRAAYANERRLRAEEEEAIEESLDAVHRRSANLQRFVDLRGGVSDGSPERLRRLATRGASECLPVKASRPATPTSGVGERFGSGTSATGLRARSANVDAEITAEILEEMRAEAKAEVRADVQAEAEAANRACRALRRLLLRVGLDEQAAKEHTAECDRCDGGSEECSSPSQRSSLRRSCEWIDRSEGLLLEWMESQKDAQDCTQCAR